MQTSKGNTLGWWRMMGRVAVVMISAGLVPHCVPTASAASKADVDAMVEKAKTFLYGVQAADGTWETSPTRQGESADYEHLQGSTWGGATAVVTYALLAAGESSQEPRLAKAIAFLKSAELIGTYAVGFRAQVWQFLPNTPERRKLALRDGQALVKSIRKEKPVVGLYGYHVVGPGDQFTDHSNSQIAVLGVATSADLGCEVPDNYWPVVSGAWHRTQNADGGWPYAPTYDPTNAPPSITSMSAAAAATLTLTREHRQDRAAGGCGGTVTDPAVDRALAWVGEHFDATMAGQHMFNGYPSRYYALYTVERAGVATGNRYLGALDWYAASGDFLLKSQQPDGSWRSPMAKSELSDTAFGLLALSYGRAPVTMLKLKYGPGDAQSPTTATKASDRDPSPAFTRPTAAPVAKKRQPAAAAAQAADQDVRDPTLRWNQRPRDVANVVRWIGGQMERRLNWETADLDAPAEQFNDAPILFIAGDRALNFDEADQAKLRRYVEAGGMIVAHADCGSDAFSASARSLSQRLFPLYEFRELPANHSVYVDGIFRRDKWPAKPSVESVSNGVRELFVLLPRGDAARTWQAGLSPKGTEPFWQLAANLYLYVSDPDRARYKGESPVVLPDPTVAVARTLELARLKYNGNWDPEPGGWRRLSAILRNRDGIDLKVREVVLGAGALKGFKIATLTGTDSFRFDQSQKEELVQFVKAGGKLLVDAAGGSAKFAVAAEAELLAALGQPIGATPLPADHALYQLAGHEIKAFVYRRPSQANVAGNRPVGPTVRALMRDGNPAVLMSNHDITGGMVGQPVNGIVGYSPDTATDIARNFVLWASRGE